MSALSALPYILDTCHTSNSFEFGWALANQLILPHVERRSQDLRGIPHTTRMKIHVLLQRPLHQGQSSQDDRQYPFPQKSDQNLKKRPCKECYNSITGSDSTKRKRNATRNSRIFEGKNDSLSSIPRAEKKRKTSVLVIAGPVTVIKANCRKPWSILIRTSTLPVVRCFVLILEVLELFSFT